MLELCFSIFLRGSFNDMFFSCSTPTLADNSWLTKDTCGLGHFDKVGQRATLAWLKSYAFIKECIQLASCGPMGAIQQWVLLTSLNWHQFSNCCIVPADLEFLLLYIQKQIRYADVFDVMYAPEDGMYQYG